MSHESKSTLQRKIADCKQGLKNSTLLPEGAIRDYNIAYWNKAMTGHQLAIAEKDGEPTEALAKAHSDAVAKWKSLSPAYNEALSAMSKGA